MPGADFKFHLQLPGFAHPGVTLVKGILDAFLMVSFSFLAFLRNVFSCLERQSDVVSHLGIFADKIPL